MLNIFRHKPWFFFLGTNGCLTLFLFSFLNCHNNDNVKGIPSSLTSDHFLSKEKILSESKITDESNILYPVINYNSIKNQLGIVVHVRNHLFNGKNLDSINFLLLDCSTFKIIDRISFFTENWSRPFWKIPTKISNDNSLIFFQIKDFLTIYSVRQKKVMWVKKDISNHPELFGYFSDFSPDSSRLAYKNPGGLIEIVNSTTGESDDYLSIPNKESITGFKFIKNGDLFIQTNRQPWEPFGHWGEVPRQYVMRHWSNKQFNTILKFESSSRESKILEVSPGQNILICYGSFNEFDVIESAETMLPQTINIQNKEMSSTPFWYSIQIPNTVTFIERNKILKVVSLDTQKEVINLDCGLFVTGALITSSNNMICLAGIDGLKILDSNYKIIYHHKLSDLIYAN